MAGLTESFSRWLALEFRNIDRWKCVFARSIRSIELTGVMQAAAWEHRRVRIFSRGFRADVLNRVRHRCNPKLRAESFRECATPAVQPRHHRSDWATERVSDVSVAQLAEVRHDHHAAE